MTLRVLIFKSSIDFTWLETSQVAHSSAIPTFWGPISAHFLLLRKYFLTIFEKQLPKGHQNFLARFV